MLPTLWLTLTFPFLISTLAFTLLQYPLLMFWVPLGFFGSFNLKPESSAIITFPDSSAPSDYPDLISALHLRHCQHSLGHIGGSAIIETSISLFVDCLLNKCLQFLADDSYRLGANKMKSTQIWAINKRDFWSIPLGQEASGFGVYRWPLTVSLYNLKSDTAGSEGGGSQNAGSIPPSP